MHETQLLNAIGISIIAATVLAFIARFVKQPLIIAYIVAGIIIGPKIGFGWISSEDDIELISEIGLILLLFIIGLEIDLKKLRNAGKSVILTGILQAPLSFVLGWVFLSLLGFSNSGGSYELLYLSFAICISSTMIVVKLLYDKSELDTLPGRITLGVLVFQDIWAIIFLAIQPNLLDPQITVLLASFAKGIGLVVLCLLLSKYVLPKFFYSIAKLPELILVASLAWCFLICGLAQVAGLSKEMGALIAGISISTFPYNLDVIAKVINIRDFFITLFFVALGMKIPVPTPAILGTAFAISFILMLTRALSIPPILKSLKLGNRIALLPTINLSQISEFSLVICALGMSYGHISEHIVSLIVFTLVITATLSTYMIQGSHSIYTLMRSVLSLAGIKDKVETVESDSIEQKSIFFLGFFKNASSIIYEIEKQGSKLKDQIRIIDFNPEVLAKLKEKGFDAQYGDISHLETLHHLGIHHAKVVVSTIPDSVLRGTSNLNILKAVKQHAPESKIIVASEDISNSLELYELGADYVIVPRLIVSAQMVQMFEKATSWTKPGINTPNYHGIKERVEIIS